MPSDVPPAPAVDLTGLAQIAGALIAIVTALTYLVRLGKLVQMLDTLHRDVTDMRRALDTHTQASARQSAEIVALRRELDLLREGLT